MTSVLLDTHAVLWFVWDDAQLSARAKSVIEDRQVRKFVSVASCWEVAIKVSVGKLDLGEASRPFLSREIARNNLELLPLTLDHVTLVEELPFHHRDPFDRILVAQTLSEQMPLISADPAFEFYGVTRWW